MDNCLWTVDTRIVVRYVQITTGVTGVVDVGYYRYIRGCLRIVDKHSAVRYVQITTGVTGVVDVS